MSSRIIVCNRDIRTSTYGYGWTQLQQGNSYNLVFVGCVIFRNYAGRIRLRLQALLDVLLLLAWKVAQTFTVTIRGNCAKG